IKQTKPKPPYTDKKYSYTLTGNQFPPRARTLTTRAAPRAIAGRVLSALAPLADVAAAWRLA
ncbi:MAG: hypothetical protein ACRYG8_00515, partial [Janthinobacterium lividum]